LGINELPVTIEEIEKNIIEIAYQNGYVKPRLPLKRTGKKVAVIGSGPSGLAAAEKLNQLGHSFNLSQGSTLPFPLRSGLRSLWPHTRLPG
jgi:glutamate synthase (NADPH/NADH) small chain